MSTSGQATATITLESRDEALLLFGSRDQFLRLIRDALEVRIIARGDTVQIEGNETQVDIAERVFVQLRQMLKTQGKLSIEDVKTVINRDHHQTQRELSGREAEQPDEGCAENEPDDQHRRRQHGRGQPPEHQRESSQPIGDKPVDG